MELWIDTANCALVKEGQRLGIICGVTTNPSLIARSGQPLERIIEQMRTVHKGPIAIQVTADQADGMVIQGKRLHAFDPHLIIKVPVTKEGLEAIHLLSKENIRTLATAIFHPNQVLLSTLAGAEYAAPYLNRMQRAGYDAFDDLRSMLLILENSSSRKTKLLAAAIADTEQVRLCAEMGVHAITIKGDIFQLLLEDQEFTQEAVERFAADWETAAPSSLLEQVTAVH